MFTLVLLAGLASFQQQTDTTFAVQPGGRLTVDNHQGAVRVRSWERNQMRIVASHASRIHIGVRQSAGVVRVEAEAVRGAAHGVNYEITVPRSFGVDIDGVYCEVAIENVDGNVSVENVQGDISVRGGRGAINLESVEGEIIVSGARGRVVAETVNKGIRITDVSADVSVESVNGSIQLSGIDGTSVSAESVNGNLQFQGTIKDGGRYRLSTHNGSLRVALPTGTNATVSVATHSGDVETDFPVELRNAVSRGRLSFVVGNGSARLDLESFSGTIRLFRLAARNR